VQLYGVPNDVRPSTNWFPQSSRLGGAWHTSAALPDVLDVEVDHVNVWQK